MDNRHNLCPHCSSMMGGSIPMLGSRCTCNDTPVTRDGFVPVVAFDMRDARITALETALAAMTAERDARDVAIGVLGEEVRVYRMHVGLCNAVNSRGWIVLSRLQRGTVASNLWSDAVRAVNTNPLARAAVEGER